MPTRDPEDLLRSIEESPASPEEEAALDAFDAAFDAAIAMSPADRKKGLEAAGVDVEALHAETAEMLARAAQAEAEAAPARAVSAPPPASVPPLAPPPSAPAPPTPPPVKKAGRSRRIAYAPLLLLAACAAAAAVMVANSFWGGDPNGSPSPLPVAHNAAPSAESPDPEVARLRSTGMDACRLMRWQLCKDLLDLADRKDPAGGKDPLIVLAKQQATMGLAGADGGRGLTPEDQNAKAPDTPRSPRGGPR